MRVIRDYLHLMMNYDMSFSAKNEIHVIYFHVKWNYFRFEILIKRLRWFNKNTELERTKTMTVGFTIVLFNRYHKRHENPVLYRTIYLSSANDIVVWIFWHVYIYFWWVYKNDTSPKFKKETWSIHVETAQVKGSVRVVPSWNMTASDQWIVVSEFRWHKWKAS